MQYIPKVRFHIIYNNMILIQNGTENKSLFVENIGAIYDCMTAERLHNVYHDAMPLMKCYV